MPVLRESPYGNFNFLVEFSGQPFPFEEVILPEVWLDVIEYRNGSDKSVVRKITGLEHVGNTVLKRGIVGSLDLYNWYNETRNGKPTALRTVVIQLRNEDQSAGVLAWTLNQARVVSIKWGPLQAKGKEVAVECVVIASESLEMAAP